MFFYPALDVETAHGALRIAVTEANHAHVSTLTNTTLSLRGKAYTISVYLYFIDGAWAVGSFEPFINHADYRLGAVNAPTIRKRLVEIAVKAANESVTELVRAQAQVAATTLELSRAYDESNAASIAFTKAKNAHKAASKASKQAQAALAKLLASA